MILCQLLLLPVFWVHAQKKNDGFRLNIHRAQFPIRIDGVIDDPDWQQAQTAADFYMVLPMDTSRAQVRTEVKMAYDATTLYLIAVCYHEPRAYLVESLRRDFIFGKNDNFLVFIDPFDDLTYGFSFGANAAGAQWDGSMYEGGKVDLNWDNKWTSAVKNYTDRWVFEAAIPFKSIRYKKGISTWGINFSRLDIKVAEKSSWAPVPRQFPTASLAYTGTLVWDSAPPPPGLNIALIPYALAGVSRDYEHKTSADYRRDVGADAKISLTSSLNLDLTVNPDFSQVEVDRQVTNLDRFELFFPEKRQFFLENADLFGNFGYASIRPFFSRRIGLGVPIRFGARLSGKPDKNWRMGIMDMKTGSVGDSGVPAQNFTVVALQRRIFSRSNIGILFVNKESLHYDPQKDSARLGYSKYNRNVGLEYNLASANNIWTGKALFLKSFSPGISGHDWVHAGHLQYSSRRWLLLWQHEYVGKNYNAEVGYIPRRNYIKINPQAGRLFFPAGGPVLSHGPKISSFYYFDESWHKTDNETFLVYTVNFRNQAIADAWAAHDYVQLLNPFDPTNSNKDTLATGTKHRWNSWGTDYISMPQKLYTITFSSRYGGYYLDGKRLNLTGGIGYRFQPYVSLTLDASYNFIDLPAPWGKTTFWLVGPRADITVSNTLFFTAFMQYNEQLKNMNLNTRLQWRYTPASDIFLVYTDNYFPAPLSVRNRAVVLKCTYWWNR